MQMFIDHAEITLQAGHGGPGRVSFYNFPQTGPDGGNGGRGGDLYIRTTSDLMALRQFTVKKTISAANGEPGSRNRKFGKDGADRVVILPIGSDITIAETGDTLELTDPDQTILFCRGGKGGKGNFEFKSSRNTTPEYAQPGLPGETKTIIIDLKLIADYGLIGLPNAGKSSLLNTITRAQAKTADYPFTTLEPNLGVFDNKIIADIPGLIEGSSTGRGLGIKFLKHIEKTATLLHCIASDNPDIQQTYAAIRKELGDYNPELLDKPEILLITKTDLLDPDKLADILKTAKSLNKHPVPISIYNLDSINALQKILTQGTK